tara:strand:- start:106 stop:300 length:195 start_codon:yes stop_codon:yes gene_type:complete
MNLETYLKLREDWESWRNIIEEVRGYNPDAITKQVDEETFTQWVVRRLDEQRLAMLKIIEEKEW